MTIELIILFAVSFLAATISGAAGFGGALVLLPVLTTIVNIKSVVPILTIGQIFGNASRVWFGRRELKWQLIFYFLLTAVPLSITGSCLFSDIDVRTIKISIGVFLILLIIYRRTPLKKISLGNKGMLLGGGITGFLSGLAGSAGPLGAAFFLSCNLTATAYVASEAFTALVIHLIKIIVYDKYALIGRTELYYGLFIGIAMIAGSWAGKKIVQKLPQDKFVLLVEIMLFISGLHFMWTA